eukprot:scaffold49450_cov41-Attheya_sp.AAC.2
MFLVAYVYQIYWVASTIGEPYSKFLEKADREGFQVMEGTTKMRAQLHHALGDINDENRPKDKVGWFDWMDMDIEEHAERKKKEKEQTVLDSLPKSMRVPGKYAPAFTPMLILGVLVTLNALILLLQVWSVGFKVRLNYVPVSAKSVVIPDQVMELADDLEAEGISSDTSLKKKGSPGEQIMRRASELQLPSQFPTHARVSPAAGKDVLVPLLYLPTLGITFEYHRRRYAYSPETETWSKIRCRTNMPTDFFGTWKGFYSEDQLTACQIRFGPNVFDVAQPTFKELYKKQLLSPFTGRLSFRGSRAWERYGEWATSLAAY